MKSKGPPKEEVAVRLDDATIARINALIPSFSMPGRDGKRSDVLRASILLGLLDFERDPKGTLREVNAVKGRWS